MQNFLQKNDIDNEQGLSLVEVLIAMARGFAESKYEGKESSRVS